MNILEIGEKHIKLHGFNLIQDNVFFIFRKNGLIIANNVDDVSTYYIKSSVENHIVNNEELKKCLQSHGFNSDHAFIEHCGEYYSER